MKKPFKAYIYVLRDPRNNAVRYVGFTQKTLSKRLSGHVSQRNGKNHRAHWIKQLYDLGLRPIIQPIFTWDDPGIKWQLVERNWIKELRAIGWKLTNTTDGGEGMLGYSPSIETRQKHSAAITGRKHSPEAREKISAALVGNKYGCGNKGKKLGPKSTEHRTKLSAANIGKKQTLESRQKISLANTGLKRSLETREKNICGAQRIRTICGTL